MLESDFNIEDISSYRPVEYALSEANLSLLLKKLKIHLINLVHSRLDVIQ